MTFYFALNNIRSAWNVGSIMRTCDALGFQLILVGYTSLPQGASLSAIKKTSIGAENTVKWQSFSHYTEVFENFPDSYHIAIEISQNSHLIYDFLSSPKFEDLKNKDIILWLGNEISGLEKDLIKQTNIELHLPMLGTKESLNVSNTATAVGYLFLEHSDKILNNTSS